MTKAQIEKVMWSVIDDALEIGPGFAQQNHVIRTTQEKLNGFSGLQAEQMILDVWYGLIREGKIVWGYDMSNPTAPFFHKPVG